MWPPGGQVAEQYTGRGEGQGMGAADLPTPPEASVAVASGPLISSTVSRGHTRDFPELHSSAQGGLTQRSAAAGRRLP